MWKHKLIVQVKVKKGEMDSGNLTKNPSYYGVN